LVIVSLKAELIKGAAARGEDSQKDKKGKNCVERQRMPPTESQEGRLKLAHWATNLGIRRVSEGLWDARFHHKGTGCKSKI